MSARRARSRSARHAVLIVAAAFLVSACDALPAAAGRQLEGPAPAPAKPTWSLWGEARKFFTSRQKIKAKATGTPLPEPAPAMPKTFGVEYKHVVAWYCKKVENKAKPLCTLPPKVGQPLVAGAVKVRHEPRRFELLSDFCTLGRAPLSCRNLTTLSTTHALRFALATAKHLG